jgi:FAD/FMN-containing dehydrogenase
MATATLEAFVAPHVASGRATVVRHSGFHSRPLLRDGQTVARFERADRQFSLQGGYPSLLGRDDPVAALSYGRSSARLAELKRRYDPHNLFRSATAFPRLASALS